MHGALLIDVTRLVLRRLRGRLPTGVDRVGLAHVQQHGGLAHAVLAWRRCSLVLRVADGQALFAWLLAPAQPPRAADWARVVLWCLRGMATPLPAGGLLLHTAHQGLEHANYAAGLRRAGVRTVVLVHDLIPLTHPEYSARGEPQRHRRRMDFALRRAAGVIVNSRDTLAQLQAHAAGRGLRVPPTVVAPLAPALHTLAVGPPPLRAPYFVLLGTIEPRKNHLLVLQLWRAMVQRGAGPVPHLVVIGRRGWECQETVHLLERSPALAAHVHQHARFTDAELACWLQHARALLFPSFVEGYGLPVVEALAHGVPVIASDLPVLHESAAGVPDYASPTDGARWQALIDDYARPDSPLRAAQLQRLAGFEVPAVALLPAADVLPR
jgi:glycosyltransferase involved in cell wall biosynthesis